MRTQTVAKLLLGSTLIAGLLMGCAASPPPSSSTGTPNAATPVPSAPETTPTPDPLASVDAIVVRPEAIDLLDASGGSVQTLDYRSDVAEALATLTRVFGEAPVDTEYAGSSHEAPSIAHRWGGFELWEVLYVNQWEGLGEPRTLIMPSFRVRFSAADANGVTLATTEGLQTGDTWAELLATPGLLTNPSGCTGPFVDFTELSTTNADGGEYAEKIIVEFRPGSDETSIAKIGAPVVANESGCA